MIAKDSSPVCLSVFKSKIDDRKTVAFAESRPLKKLSISLDLLSSTTAIASEESRTPFHSLLMAMRSGLLSRILYLCTSILVTFRTERTVSSITTKDTTLLWEKCGTKG
jgi:hypothetical protein